jgi:ATP-dependent protease ClpP protease subunit
MAKEILLYFPIGGFTAEEFINTMEAAKNEEIKIRFNSPGGDVFRGYGAITKIREHTKPVNGIVDGLAASMAGAMLPYLDNVKATNVSFIMIHAAQNGNDPDPGRQKVLRKINEDLLKAFQNKIDANTFREVTGVSLEDLFLNDAFKDRDIWLTAAEAERIGLVDEVLDINSEDFSALEKNFAAFNEKILFLNQQSIKDKKENTNSDNEKPNKMTKAELKENHPEVYNAIYNEGIESGVKKGEKLERDRVSAFANFFEADGEGVIKSIKDGDEFNSSALSDLTQKALKKGVEASAEDDSPGDTNNANPKAEDGKSDDKKTDDKKDDPKAEAKAENLKTFLAEVDENLGLKN